MPQDGPIPAHLLGNMWAQNWTNIYDLVGPDKEIAGYDLTSILQEKGFDPIRMVKTGEAFFSSLGFEQLPETFWQRSLFVKPADRDVVCHASAWDVDEKDDLRIKMCIKINARTSEPSTTNWATITINALTARFLTYTGIVPMTGSTKPLVTRCPFRPRRNI